MASEPEVIARLREWSGLVAPALQPTPNINSRREARALLTAWDELQTENAELSKGYAFARGALGLHYDAHTVETTEAVEAGERLRERLEAAERERDALKETALAVVEAHKNVKFPDGPTTYPCVLHDDCHWTRELAEVLADD